MQSLPGSYPLGPKLGVMLLKKGRADIREPEKSLPHTD